MVDWCEAHGQVRVDGCLECYDLRGGDKARIQALEASLAAHREALREMIDAGDQWVTSEDDVASMIRFGEAEANARRLLGDG